MRARVCVCAARCGVVCERKEWIYAWVRKQRASEREREREQRDATRLERVRSETRTRESRARAAAWPRVRRGILVDRCAYVWLLKAKI